MQYLLLALSGGWWIGGKSSNLVCSGKTYTSMYNTMQWSPAASDGAEPAVNLRFSQLQQHICTEGRETEENGFILQTVRCSAQTRAAGV